MASSAHPWTVVIVMSCGFLLAAPSRIVRADVIFPTGIFSSGGISTALDRAYADGVKYFEPWDTDIFNSALTPTFSSLESQINAPEPLGLAIWFPSAVLLLARIRPSGRRR